ncbi:MAG: autotransporter-associated beta strand repeat containing protein, partial [Solidesulfovibrio magneticus str. Maddingley MBC34]
GVISGEGTLTKSGSGTLVLSGTNTYSGATAITGGSLSISSAGNLQGTSSVTLDGGTLQATSTLTLGKAIALGSGGGVLDIVTSGDVLTLSGAISGSGSLTKTGSGTLTLSGTNDYSGGTTISAGTLSISSAGNLQGTSGVTLAGGTLQATSTLTLNKSIALGSGGGAFEVANSSDTLTISGVITDAVSGTAGSLTKTGSGTLYLTGVNTYTGGTNIHGGTVNIVADANLGDASGGLTLDGGILQIGADVASSRAVTLGSGGGSFDTNGHDLTLNGTVSGSGGLTKTGSGTLTLSGDAAYTGPTAIQAGTLSLGGSCSSSSMAVASGATLNFAPTKDVTYAGSITGSGHVTKTGDDPLTLSGDNSGFTGDLTLAAGTLSVSNDNNLGASTASLAFNGGTLATTADMTIAQPFAVNAGGGVLENSGNALTLANSLSGSGNLTLTGSGTTNLGASFDGSAYSGTLSVNGGTLHLVDGETLGGTLTITSGGTLNGVGTVGNLNVSGVIAPGNSPGVITVTGDFVQSATGVYACQLTPTANDLIAVTGNATLSGTISIQPEYTYYNSGTVWIVLTTQTGRVSGTYSTVTYGATPENWIFVPVYSANAVTIILERQSYSTSSTSSQASSVGVSLDAVAYNATGEMASLIKNLDYSYGTTTGYSPANALTNYALNVLSAEVYDVFSQNVFAAGRLLTAAQHAGLHEGEEGVGQGFASPLEIGPASLASQNNQYGLGLGLDTTGGGASSLSLGRFGVFVRPIGMRAFQQGSSSQTGYAAVSGGITGGVTYRPTSELTLALAPGFVTQSINIHSEGGGQGTITDWSLGLLAAYRSGPWHADAGLRGAYNAFRSSRSLPLPSGSYTAKGNWDGWNVNVSTGGGYDFVVGDYTFGPLAAASWQRLHENAFKERGAGTLGQSVRARDTQALNTVLGARVARTFETPAGDVTPEVRLGWSAQWLGESQNIVASFIGSPGSAYQVKSANHAYHSALVDVGVSMRVSSKLTATARAGVELLRPGYESQAASIGLKYTF